MTGQTETYVEYRNLTVSQGFVDTIRAALRAYPMPRPFGEGLLEIDEWLRDWQPRDGSPAVTWPDRSPWRGQDRVKVAGRLRFLLWRYEDEGWTP